MRLRMVSDFDANGKGPLFLMFHGYGNDESEMVRIINAVYAGTGEEPDYLSFRGTYARPYMGGHYWYPDGCGVDERQRECTAVGDTLTQLLDAPAFKHRRKVLIGFSQGGYLSYRLVKAHPYLFDAAILLSPSFKGEEEARLNSLTRFFLAYGSSDHTIPLPDQRTARTVLEAAGYLTYREYPGMGHAICDEEISDIRDFLTAQKL
ncbi:alpha/beta hydrolase [Bifidobacterium olomucense]|uniref:Phospholipase/carboxylesterase like protein n=1 Tax=Bifidobacterium olomucense TaxID=2675324 RepID=A0A7Y0HV49_9BIFI|nr:dienelactone hydrolase family protein [Bifidobacterium sp. DSM 109959]NMM97890.1 phospholipase/carboxylesterase like protein [Bifidobacterium sp. DSM 109959]